MVSSGAYENPAGELRGEEVAVGEGEEHGTGRGGGRKTRREKKFIHILFLVWDLILNE